MKKKIWIPIVLLLILVVGAFLYVWYVWIPAEMEKENRMTDTEPPTLFEKGDYKVENRTDGKYITVDKVGFEAEVPSGWDIELDKRVKIYSPDFALDKDMLIKEGCQIDIVLQNAERAHKELEENIELFRENPTSSLDKLKSSYALVEKFNIVNIDGYTGLEFIPRKSRVTGRGSGLNFPLEDHITLSISLSYPLKSSSPCVNKWQEFIDEVNIN